MRNSISAVSPANLQPRRILQARHLDQNPVGALALDDWLNGAELIDALFDDLDGLLDGLTDAIGDGGRRHGETDSPVAGVRNFEER